MVDSTAPSVASELSQDIRRLLGQAQAMFFQLYERLFPVVSNVLRKVSKQAGRPISSGEVADLTGHVFSRLWETLTRADRPVEFKSDVEIVGYLKRIATNHLMDQFRHRRDSPASLDALPALPLDPRAAPPVNEEEVDQREVLAALTKLLQSLQNLGSSLPILQEHEPEPTGKPGPKGGHLASKMRRLFNTVDEVMEAIRKATRSEF